MTLLLTDIAASTRLWDTAPDAMAAALVRHDAIVRDLVAAHGGRVIKPRGEGDSTFSVFERPDAAAEAALALQAALTHEAWPTPTPIRVRMAIHTGEPVDVDGDYYGPVVNRVARLRSSAVPGQVLVTAAVADLIAASLPDGAALHPVGQQSLRGLTRPEYVYRLARPRSSAEASGSPDTPLLIAGAVPFPARLAMTPSSGFVGRRIELEALARRAAQVSGGGVALVLLSGEPGVGKTRLAAEAGRAAHGMGMSVLYGRCDPELGIPYQPFVEALREYIEAAPAELVDRYAARYGGDLARLIPALPERAAWLSMPAVTSDPETEGYLLFEAVLRLIEAASAEAPVVLVLDDLHWADRNTLLLLRYAMESTAPMRLLVVAVYRHSDVATGHPLLQTLADLVRTPSVERLRLGGLDDDELARFVVTLAGHELDERGEALVQWLQRETAGNPFFTEAILRHLAESGAVRREDGCWTVVTDVDDLRPPDSVMEVIRQRVARLGEPAQRALSSAAVIGREFDMELLAAALGEPEDTILTALEHAAGAALVTEVATQPGRFAFAHALVNHSLYVGLSATRRARLHRTVAQEMEVRYGHDLGDRLPELAAHWLAARVPAEASRTIDYARRAGDHALDRLAPHDALRWYDKALSLAVESNAADAVRADLLIRLGVAQRQAGDGRFRATLFDAATLAEQIGDRDALVRAALANNRGGNTSGRVDRERLAVLERALDAVGDADSPARARLLATFALESNFGGGWEPQLAFSDDALSMARRVGDPATLAAVLALRHEAIRLPHTLSERLANTAEHLELAERLGDPAQVGFGALWRSRAALESGDLAEVDRCMTIVAEVSGAHPYLRWNAATHWSYRHLIDGRLEDAERCTYEAYRTGLAMEQPDAGAFLAAQLINVRWDQGRLYELEPMLDEAAHENVGIPAFRAVLALACCEADKPSRARELFDREAISGFAAFRYDPIWLCSFVVLGEVCVQLGDRARAPSLYERLAPWRGQIAFSGVSVFGSVAHYLGQLAAVARRYDEAERDFADAASAHERLGAPVFLARTRLAWARMLAERAGAGGIERATLLAGEAQSVARRLGAARLACQAQDLLQVRSAR